MEVDDLYRLLDGALEFTGDTLLDLREMVEKYPFFQLARILYLKNLAVVHGVNFLSELNKMAVFLPDREQLFLLIEGEKYGLSVIGNEEGEKDDRSFSLIDAFLLNNNESEEMTLKQDTPLLLQPSASSDYLHWSLSDQANGGKEEDDNQLLHQDLIDSFLQNDQQRSLGTVWDKKEETARPEAPESVKKLDDGSAKSLEDSCLTETLARIYIKQKRYDKALQIIKNLSLKYPEKNVYFADQIRFLEKLIINTKK